MLITSENLNDLRVGFSAAFQGAFDATPGQADYLRVAMEVPSATKENIYPWLGNTFGMRKWLGDRQMQNLKTYDFKIPNESYEGTISVDRDEIEDDTFGIHTPMISMMGNAAASHPNTLVFSLLKNGASSLCFDGQYFFDTDHPGYDSTGALGSWSNNMGGSSTAWYLVCTKMPIKPFIFQKRRPYQFAAMDAPNDQNVFMRKKYIYGVDARVAAGYAMPQLVAMSKQDLTHDNYAAARAALMNQFKENGDPMGIVPDLLVVPGTLEGKGRKVVLSETKANGESNEWKGSAELLTTSWL